MATALSSPAPPARKLRIAFLPLSHKREEEESAAPQQENRPEARRVRGGEKIIHFVRHGQGEHNLEFEDRGAGTRYEMEEYRDARLTGLGHRQALHAAKKIMAMAREAEAEGSQQRHVELVVASPLTRAIQTALPTYRRLKEHGTRFVIHEAIREGMTEGVHPCNARRNKSELLREYGFVREFVHLAPHHEEMDHDPIWNEHYVESPEELRARARAFLNWLVNREERTVAVFAHCVFYIVLFTPRVVDHLHPSLPCAPEFENGEVKSILLRWEEVEEG